MWRTKGSYIDMTGCRFGRLVAVRVSPIKRRRTFHWECVCDCGAAVSVAGDQLRGGKTQSCGCYHAEIIAGGSNRRHGQARAKTREATPEYAAWTAAKTRCYNPKIAGYKDYGGQGVRMATEWLNDFPAFFAHVGPRPSPKHSLDRKDPWGHYEPGNVRWATAKEQANNQRRHHPRPHEAATLTAWK